MFNTLKAWLRSQGLPGSAIRIVEPVVSVFLLLAVAWVSSWLARRYLIPFLEAVLARSGKRWGEAFVRAGFFRRLSGLLPAVVVYLAADLIFPVQSPVAELIRRLTMTWAVLVAVRVADALLLAARGMSQDYEGAGKKPIRGYLDAVKIVLYVLTIVFVIAILTDRSPWGIISVLGGLTAVVLLIFKDAILGFVASLTLSANDMVRVGDWIEMEKYGADGDVEDISIHTVKVRNWDKTIATIPTYALVSDAFKNWRGMSESGGRRIKRAVHIDMSSIRFCTDEMLARFEKFEFLREYLRSKKEEIDQYNKARKVDASQSINGRCQTNIGVFRAYIIAYLRQHPQIHQGMTFLVRHLQPTPQGLPIEIYVFSSDQVWANYESIQADIFDHILAAVPEFGLRIFQYPSGHDMGGALQGAR